MRPDDPRLRPYDPELYDLTHRGNPGDVAFYVEACQADQRVLELGCGSGRIARALARAGCQVVGLDNHAGMLAEARRMTADLPPEVAARLTYTQGDMRTFALDGFFERIIIPYNGLYCLLTDEDVAACLAAVQRHLAPGGQLLLDAYRVFTPDPDLEPEPDPEEPVAVLTDGERTVHIYERTDWDPSTQQLDAWYRYRIESPDGPSEQTYCIPQRYLDPEDLERLIEAAGLAIVEFHGDFDRNAFEAFSETMVVVATRTHDDAPTHQ